MINVNNPSKTAIAMDPTNHSHVKTVLVGEFNILLEANSHCDREKTSKFFRIYKNYGYVFDPETGNSTQQTFPRVTVR